MTTIDRYRRCFEACGVKLPDMTGIRWMEGYSAFLERIGGPELGQYESLCVLRCAAEDWIRNLHDNEAGVITTSLSGDAHPIMVAASWYDGEMIEHECCGRDIHDALIALVYAVAGKQEQA